MEDMWIFSDYLNVMLLRHDGGKSYIYFYVMCVCVLNRINKDYNNIIIINSTYSIGCSYHTILLYDLIIELNML